MTHAGDVDVDVLVVGAGPVGTALALELALHGVSFRIVDRLPVRSDKSRALIMQPRTLELLNRHGAADSMISRGRILRGGSAYIDRQLVARLDLDDLGTIDTEFPLPLNVSQAETERFLDECLAKYDVAVERPVAATSIVQDDAGVTTVLARPGGATETVRSMYVVGCDGAHSVVRHASEAMRFPGAPYPQSFILCDVRLDDSSIPRDRLNLYFRGRDLLAVFSVNHELVRIVASENEGAAAAPAKDDNRTHGPSDRDVPTLDELQAHFARMTPPGSGTLRDPAWLARFRVHHRCATQYRDGRLLVAGDAAHIHSPAGGQGMNAGIQDAVNLGWKLAHAVAPRRRHSLPDDDDDDEEEEEEEEEEEAAAAAAAAAATALLDTYDLERRPVGLALLRGTDRIFAFVAGPPAWLVPLRDWALRHVVPRVAGRSSRRRRRLLFGFMSNLGVHYRGRSRIVGEARGFGGARVRGGDRLADGAVVCAGSEGPGLENPGESREARESGEGVPGARGRLARTSLQRICAGRAHHLLLFAAPGGETGKEELGRAAETVVRACQAEVAVHYIAAGDKVVPRAGWYTDVEGTLHDKFGFGKRAGYVLVRPDGYVAHIGPLARLDDLVAFLEGYLVSPVVAPVRPARPLAYLIAWAVAGVLLAAKLLGRFAWDPRR